MLRRVLRLARMLCALMYRQNGDLANLLKSAREKCAPECPFECGGGCNRYLGNAQIECALTSLGLPLRVTHRGGIEHHFKTSFNCNIEHPALQSLQCTAVELCPVSLGGFKEALTRQAIGLRRSAQWAGLKLVSGCIPS